MNWPFLIRVAHREDTEMSGAFKFLKIWLVCLAVGLFIIAVSSPR